MNLFETLKELDITICEFMAAPDYLTDSHKIIFIMTFKAIKKARKHHAMRARQTLRIRAAGLTDRGLPK